MLTNEKVIVVQGDASKWYSQAVFIMNQGPLAEKTPVDLVAEAEKIIFNYVAKKRKYTGESTRAYLEYKPPTIISAEYKKPVAEEKRRFKLSFLLYGLMMLACIAMTVIFAVGWLR